MLFCQPPLQNLLVPAQLRPYDLISNKIGVKLPKYSISDVRLHKETSLVTLNCNFRRCVNSQTGHFGSGDRPNFVRLDFAGGRLHQGPTSPMDRVFLLPTRIQVYPIGYTT